ncbi:UNVERIFIED_CONTAM: hypothetical protein FKN15_015972 [Acipenser sinensis]
MHQQHQHHQQQELQQLQLSAAAQIPMNSLLTNTQAPTQHSISTNPFLAMHGDPSVQKVTVLTTQQMTVKTKELDSRLRRALVANYNKGNGYRAVSKKYGIPKSTIGALIKKYHRTNSTETLERSGRTKKITGTASSRIVQAAKKKIQEQQPRT